MVLVIFARDYGNRCNLTRGYDNPCDLGIMLIQQHQTILLLKLQSILPYFIGVFMVGLFTPWLD